MLRIYNTLTRKLENLEPREKGKISMYVCGLTPYDYAHLGHARTYVAFDIIRRYLLYRGYKVYFVQNVTDIDDKIIERAKEKKEDPRSLAARFDEEGRKDLRALNILPADAYPKVSEHIPEIIALIQKLIEKGYAYVNESGVYFEVRKFKDYGKLSAQSLDQIKAGARIEVDEKKKDPADFALWKAAKQGELSFPSPWGEGRPGWHIECSAMSMKYIKGTIDIHGGGQDLIFPHHENEIAQSEAATGKKFVKYWLHTGFLTVGGEKMAKSLGNFVTIREILKEYDANALRMFFAGARYRSPIDFSRAAIEQAHASVQRIFNAKANALSAIKMGKKGEADREERERFSSLINSAKERFVSAMDNDFDTPNALSALFEIVHAMNEYSSKENADPAALKNALSLLSEILSIFGIKEKEAGAEAIEKLKEMLSSYGIEARSDSIDELMEKIIALRESARKSGDFKKSDEIRARLREIGISLEDGKRGPLWKILT